MITGKGEFGFDTLARIHDLAPALDKVALFKG